MAIRLVVVYGCECWARQHIQEMRAGEIRTLRWISCNVLRNRIINLCISRKLEDSIKDKMRELIDVCNEVFMGTVRMMIDRSPWSLEY